MLRWLTTAIIVALLLVAWRLPNSKIGRRGSEAQLRADVANAVPRLGEPLPDLHFEDLDGAPLRLADFRGHRVLLTFERSVDW